MSNVTLYQLTGEWLTLSRQLSEMDFDAQTIADTLEGSEQQMALEEKVQGYEMVARNIEAPVAAIDAEIERLQALKATYMNRSKSLRMRVLKTMQDLGVQKITCPLFEVSRRKNPSRVVLFEESLVPSRFWKKPEVELTVDKKAVKDALDAGEDVQGARLEQSERLQIK
ncbi:siphovirus Gp157 family protein [Delftia tsuruhatensis]|uniref:siphovirus Gp157 family protein n=1 Tax=Delftia tsuruhatensis TaxID=180282 RepID=UPI002260FB16|nr:siphovirus Gp157 family protein [Delftia tsuruhatensis]MCX7509559.1 siphovirus Gp157 family protein [Delftia tsuruhatensis]